MVHVNWPCSVCGTPTSGYGPTLCAEHRALLVAVVRDNSVFSPDAAQDAEALTSPKQT
jgi:hypothetical protein